ncbi:hypothetical protein [Enterovirga sp.]|uniref:hypothetical protein n=1 Tax=Enterovirga sp. TaxID=2026350 RepID=UPI00261919AE|nr:hypothetical protein [Enterovirga sp.]MDB5590774.1 hypothetical protein [Enterovirga sp.]
MLDTTTLNAIGRQLRMMYPVGASATQAGERPAGGTVPPSPANFGPLLPPRRGTEPDRCPPMR